MTHRRLTVAVASKDLFLPLEKPKRLLCIPMFIPDDNIMYVIWYNKSENKSDTTSSETKCEVNEDKDIIDW